MRVCPRSEASVVLMALLCVVSFAGCGSPSSAPNQTVQTPAPATSQSSERPAISTAPAGAEAWTPAQTVEPTDLERELGGASATRPTVVCVGFESLYRGGHVPGASFHGPASSPEGLADLTRWAQGVSRSTNVVLYCGCCPFAECPNVRPAFTALHNMGFTHVRVLNLPTNFATNWAGSGHPIER
jgi:thiosulfate/3-mercaptopyruvate sulfurtransferase